MTISVLLAGLLWGCDSTSTPQVVGTSSETVTGLQLLADNAGTIATGIPVKEEAAGRVAVVPEVIRDTANARIDSVFGVIDCEGGSQSHYEGLGKMDKMIRSRGVGPDGRTSSCSGDYSRHWYRQQYNDSNGWRDFEGMQIDSGMEYNWTPDRGGWIGIAKRSEYTGTGIWRLHSGFVLRYDSMSMSARYESGQPTSLRFVQKIRFAETCRVDLDFDLSAPIDAPVSCNGAVVGRFTWLTRDNWSSPVVLDLQGQRVVPRGTGAELFAEDSLGLSLSQARVDIEGSISTLRANLGWRLLPGDAIVVGDTIRALVATTGWSGFAVLGENGAFVLPLGAVNAGAVLNLSVVKQGFEAKLAVPLPASGAVQVELAARSMALSFADVRNGFLRPLR